MATPTPSPGSATSISTGSALRLGGTIVSSSGSATSRPSTARSRTARASGLAAEAIPEDSAIASLMHRPEEVARIRDGFLARTHSLLRAMGTGDSDPYGMDLCFVFDATGSMGSYIAATKETIRSIASLYRSRFPKYTLRLGFVAYRDFGDERPIETLNFTESADEFAARLGAVSATGGADEAEDVIGGLEAALRLDWSGRRRVLFHVADAPSHGTLYHDGANDSHTGFDSDGAKGRSVMQQLAAKSVDFYFCRINSSTDKMVRVFAAAYNPAARKPLVTFALGAAANELAGKVLDTVCSTVTSSSMAIRKGELAMDVGEYAINKEPIEWTTAPHARWGPWQTVERLAFKPLGALEEIEGEALVSPPAAGAVRLRFSTEPCARGSTRLVYWAITEAGERLVAKVWSVTGAPELVRELNVGAARCLAVAQFFAKRFNGRLAKAGVASAIGFVATHVCEAAAGRGRATWMTLEPLIEGEFVKYNSNDGFVLHGTPDSELLQAFSHYTADRSHGRLLVDDLQGPRPACLTDPAVQFSPTDVAAVRPASARARAPAGTATTLGLSRLALGTALNRRVIADGSVPYFSATDIGATGFARFFETHECGPTCRLLKLVRPAPSA